MADVYFRSVYDSAPCDQIVPDQDDYLLTPPEPLCRVAVYANLDTKLTPTVVSERDCGLAVNYTYSISDAPDTHAAWLSVKRNSIREKSSIDRVIVVLRAVVGQTRPAGHCPSQRRAFKRWDADNDWTRFAPFGNANETITAYYPEGLALG